VSSAASGVTTPGSAPGPRVLVTDAMPVNGGDEALLFGLLRGMHKARPSTTFTVLCHKAEESRRLLPNLHIEPALGCGEDLSRVEPFYRRADLVVSTPGGFLHEHYDIRTPIRGFELAASLGTPFVLFGQSIGPFTTDDNRSLVGQALRRAALVAVRDSASLRHVLACGVAEQQVIQVPDVAFLWRRLARHRYVAKSGRPRRAALCFRRWPLNDRHEFKETIRKARHLVEHLASRGIEEFLFVSTCQGVPGYVNDAELSARIVESLDGPLRERCVVDSTRYHPEEMIDVLSGCDVMFSMRLHGCLLALLGGTPAMGLAYESKTPEIFRQLDMKQYQLPFTSFQTRWCECASALLDELDAIRERLPATLDKMGYRASRALETLNGLVS
jgi:colanic acid/amylovoran biosynthesis protein